MKPLQLPAQMGGVATKVDGSLSLRFSTQELSNEQKVQVMEYVNEQGWLLFAPNKFKDADVPAEDAPDGEKKTDSQRLRAVLWLYHKQSGGKEEDFEAFKHRYMEKRIKEIKGKLE